MRRREHIKAFVETIWEWFAHNKRALPWRDLEARPAYMVPVSEVMLQQTQVERVRVIFRRFLERFAGICDLARASNREVLLAWRGLGYNSRALRLRDAARAIVDSFLVSRCSLVNDRRKTKKRINEVTHRRGRFPTSMEDLQQIPGVGQYTAAAIRNFAFNLPTPCLDTNIRRVLHRAFAGPEKPDGTFRKDDRYLLKLAGEILGMALLDERSQIPSTKPQIHSNCQISSPNGSAGRASSKFRRTAAEWHAALMDYGSLVCAKKNPRWDICPLTQRGLMKAAFKVRLCRDLTRLLREPGRYVGARYIPNRIVRGKIVEELRDEPQGLPLAEIGRRVCIDWSPREHRRWLAAILAKLMKDRLLTERRRKYVLTE